MMRMAKDIRPLQPRKRTQDDVNIPAAIICGIVKPPLSDKATAAMVFIGCTGMGMSNIIPVIIL